MRSVGAVILAGGRGTRMGAGIAKPLRLLAGKPLIAHVLDRLDPALCPVAINAGDPAAYARFGHPIVPDARAGFAGPLAGIEAGLAWHAARGRPVRTVLVVAADMPFLPRDLAARLMAAREAGDENRVVIARAGGRLQPTAALWPLCQMPSLTAWLDADRPRAIRAYLDHAGFLACDIAEDADPAAPDPFDNLNTVDELARAQARFLGKSV